METKRESPFIGAATPYDNQTFSIHVQIHKRKSDMNLKEHNAHGHYHIYSDNFQAFQQNFHYVKYFNIR